MPEDESDDYLRGLDRGVEVTVKSLTDVLERGKQGPYANPELDRFATLLDKMRPALHKLAEPAVRACLVRVQAALAAVEEHVRGVEWALVTHADTPLGAMELLGVIVTDIERAIEKWKQGESPVREGAKPDDTTVGPLLWVLFDANGEIDVNHRAASSRPAKLEAPDGARWVPYHRVTRHTSFPPSAATDMVAHGIARGAFLRMLDLLPLRALPSMPYFQFFEVDREIFRAEAKKLLAMLASDTRPVS